MSGRYVGWRRLKGDSDRPDLLDVGKRLLGYLDNQRTLSGVLTMAAQTTLPDGSVVSARWLGNLPEIMVKEGPPRGAWTWVDGFAFRPTTAAQNDQPWFGGDGTGAYEVANYRLQVLLTRPYTSAATTLAPAWYDDNALWWPGDPAPASFYAPALGESAFRYAANLDWTGDAGTLYFFGPPSRLTDFIQQFGTVVLHNGQVLLDLNNAVSDDFTPSASAILGAALAGTKEAPQLRMSVGALSGDELVLRIATANLSWINGRLQAATDEDGLHVLTQRGAYTVTRMSGQVACMFWNQSGNECRTVMPRYDEGINEIRRYAEIVATRNTDGSFTIAEAAEHVAPPEAYERVTTRTGSVSLNTGSIESRYGSFEFPDEGSGIADTPDVEVDVTTYLDNDWFKIAVDYRDDVPVYLEHKRKHGTRTSNGTYARNVIATDPGDDPFVPGNPVQLFYDSLNFAQWYVGGGYVNGQSWAPTGLVETTTIYAIAQDYATSYRTDFLTLDATDTETTTLQYDNTVNATGDYFGTDTAIQDRDQVIETQTIRPLYVDLRHRLLAYQRKTRTVSAVYVETVTRDYGVSGDPSEFERETVRVGSTSDTSEWASIFTVNGVEVQNTLTETQTTSSGGSTSTETEASGWSLWWTEPSMYARLILVAFGAAGVFNDAQDTDSEYVVPGTNWAFYAKEFALNTAAYSIGSWVCSRNLVAYSYPVATLDGGILLNSSSHTFTASDFVTGLCTTAGVPVTLDLADLLNDPGTSKIRHFPIMAISPYPTRR